MLSFQATVFQEGSSREDGPGLWGVCLREGRWSSKEMWRVHQARESPAGTEGSGVVTGVACLTCGCTRGGMTLGKAVPTF